MNSSRFPIILLPISIVLLLCYTPIVRCQGTQGSTSSTVKPITPQRPPDATTDRTSSDDVGPLTTFEEELKAKRLIKLAEKEHQENVERARELSKLSQELKEDLQNGTRLAREDVKKVDRLEKLTKKIRGEAGGEDDDVQIADVPSDLPSAVTQIADTAELLSKDVQNTPRQVVSTAVIDRANVLLQLVKILRGFLR